MTQKGSPQRRIGARDICGCVPVVLPLLRNFLRLIGEAAQTQSAGKVVEDAYALIETEEVDGGRAQFGRQRDAALTMPLCRGLVSQPMVSKAEGPFRPHQARWMPGGPRDVAALFSQRQGIAEDAEPREKELETSKKV